MSGGEPLRAVLFDYGLTLVTYRRPEAALRRAHSRIAAAVAARLAVPAPDPAELLAAVHDVAERAVAEHEARGRLDELDLVAVHRAAYATLGLEPGDALLDSLIAAEQEAWVEGMTVAAGVVETLGRLRRLGIRLGICSNAPYRPESMRDQLRRLGLLPLLDAAVLSGEVGWRKPSPRIFEAAAAALGLRPGQVLMVGDRLAEDAGGARAAGMRSARLRQHRDDADPTLTEADWVLDHVTEVMPLAASLSIAPRGRV